MAKFSDYLRNIFWLLILLQFAPLFLKGIKDQYENIWETKTKVGLITIKGTLSESTRYVKQLRKFFEDEKIKAILIRMDSPGGLAGTSQAVFNEIKELKKNVSPKFVAVFVENIAASGGYYIASAADYIVATPSAFIGSIGSYIAHPVVKEFIEYHKFKYDIIKSGAYKAVGSPFLDLTPDQRSYLQKLSDNVYHQFVADIQEQRKKANLNPDIKQWAEGKIFTGEQALKLGLVDKLGSISTAEEILKERAPIVGKIDWVKPPKKGGLLQNLFSQDDDSDSEGTLESAVKSVCSTLEQRYGTQMYY